MLSGFPPSALVSVCQDVRASNLNSKGQMSSGFPPSALTCGPVTRENGENVSGSGFPPFPSRGGPGHVGDVACGERKSNGVGGNKERVKIPSPTNRFNRVAKTQNLSHVPTTHETRTREKPSTPLSPGHKRMAHANGAKPPFSLYVERYEKRGQNSNNTHSAQLST